jgi:hypothetical protein
VVKSPALVERRRSEWREEEVSGDGDLGHGLPFWPSGMWPCGWVMCFFFTQWNEFKKMSFHYMSSITNVGDSVDDFESLFSLRMIQLKNKK